MSKVNTDPKLVKEVLERGVENIYPDKKVLEKAMLSGKRLRLYNGIDPSGKFLHLGHAVVLKKLKQFQELGHEVIMLIGDFTGMIGDPTDKLAARVPLTREQVLANSKNYKKQAGHILNFSGKNPVKILYNSKWNKKLDFRDVLKLASEFTVQRLLERDMFDKRMQEGKAIHLHEFLYPLIQGYDSVAMNVDLEVGGNDQTFNMLCGRDMQKNRGREKFVLSTKLLVDPTGKKMGKTEGNMITLVDSPQEMYGKVMSWTDEMVLPGFEILTSVPLEEVSESKIKADPMNYKKRLAKEVVKEFLGEKAAQEAEENFVKVIQNKEAPADMPKVYLKSGEEKIKAIDLFIKAGLVSSKTEARRLVGERGLAVDDVIIESAESEVVVKEGSVLRRGKRHFAQVAFK